MAKKHCEHCGATTVQYTHNMNIFLIEGLTALQNAGGVESIKNLGLDNNEWNNFQKLRYWDLISKHYEGDRRISGVWAITQKGRDFLANLLKIDVRVLTYRGVRIKYQGDLVTAKEIIENTYKQRVEYAEDAEPLDSEQS